MSYLSDLQTRKENVATELAAMTSTSAGGKPDAAKSGVGHVSYRLSLLQELSQLDQLIQQAIIQQNQESGGFIVVSEILP